VTIRSTRGVSADNGRPVLRPAPTFSRSPPWLPSFAISKLLSYNNLEHRERLIRRGESGNLPHAARCLRATSADAASIEATKA
jgi:hypothetical protein